MWNISSRRSGCTECNMSVGPHQLSQFHIELNPWCTDADLERSLLLRGAYLSAAGYVETLLTEWVIRASRLPEYRDIRGHFPSRRKDRLIYIQDVVSRPGSLEKISNAMSVIVGKFEEVLDLRDILAHASMSVISMRGVAGGASLTFVDYFAESKSIQRRAYAMSLDDLETRATDATETSRKAYSLNSEIDGLLPAIKV